MDDKLILKELRSAIKSGDFATVRGLLTANPKCVTIDTPFGSWLHVAASFGRVEIVEYLIRLGLDVDKRGGFFDAAPIKEAASDGHIGVVKQLLDVGAGLDTSEPERNPLFGAIYGGHLEIVKLLIERGIDYRVRYTGKSMKNMDALAFAKERGQTEIVAYLTKLKR